ncbi:BCAM0308 family protein [Aquabacterium sp.]|uniref:BCAM0308 family protein n=1 Tax=Aquabacterium sp. TaxID=1872578 RepID=UPI003784C40F
MNRNTPRPAERHGRASMAPEGHDPYRREQKIPEPSFCPDCGAVFEAGHWQWKEPLSALAPKVTCPACLRQREHDPAGYLLVEGPFLQAHRDELVHLLERRAEQARSEHPLQRLMGMAPQPDGGLMFTTTSVRLARALGSALEHAYHGELEVHASPDQDLVRLRWSR